MRNHYRKVLIATCFMLCRSESAHANEDKLNHLVILEQNGQFDDVIHGTSHLLRSSQLNLDDAAASWVLLGTANQAEGHVSEAQKAYDRALHLLSGEPRYDIAYANVLEHYATLHRDVMQLETAVALEKKALAIYERRGDHLMLARAYAMLGQLEMDRGKDRECQADLLKALAETKVLREADTDLLAEIATTQGWLALKRHDLSGAISSYQHSLELWKEKHSEPYFMSGWTYVLLGNAYLQRGTTSEALVAIEQGIKILDQTVGENNPMFHIARITYARALHDSGAHAEAASVRKASEKALQTQYGDRCAGCTINVVAFR
jgi:tetratricopeptide (TPR) repeat protein